MDVDAGLRASRRSYAHPRLCGDARGRHDRVCEELAKGVMSRTETLQALLFLSPQAAFASERFPDHAALLIVSCDRKATPHAFLAEAQDAPQLSPTFPTQTVVCTGDAQNTAEWWCDARNFGTRNPRYGALQGMARTRMLHGGGSFDLCTPIRRSV